MFTTMKLNEIQVILADYVGKKYVEALANKIVGANQGELEIRKDSTAIYEIKEILKNYLEENDVEECFKRLTNPAAEKIDTFNVEGSECDYYEELLKYHPCTEEEEKYKRNLEIAICAGIKSFKVPVNDPSFSEDGKLLFIAGAKPAVGYSYKELEKIAKENALRLGTKNEYILFLATLINRLIAQGWSMKSAWNAVCNDSKKLGHYCNSKDSIGNFESTGSRMFAGKCDLVNTYKILKKVDEESGFWVAGGYYGTYSYCGPLAALIFYKFCYCEVFCNNSVGWFVF